MLCFYKIPDLPIVGMCIMREWLTILTADGVEGKHSGPD